MKVQVLRKKFKLSGEKYGYLTKIWGANQPNAPDLTN